MGEVQLWAAKVEMIWDNRKAAIDIFQESLIRSTTADSADDLYRLCWPGSVDRLQVPYAVVTCTEVLRPYDKRCYSHVRRLCKIESLPRPERKPAEGQVVDAVSVGAGEGPTVEETTQAMPGVLLRSENDAKIAKVNKTMAGGLEEKMANAHAAAPQAQPLTNGIKLTNGVNPSNGTEADGAPADAVESQANPMNGIEKLVDGQLPPEIEHISFGMIPLSSLISRLAQETFNSLTETINEMADIRIAPPSNVSGFSGNQVNGTSSGDHVDDNTQKKERLLNFAVQRRHQFIKALVIAQWSRQAEQVGKCIDLKLWMDNQKQTYDSAVAWVGRFKVSVEHSKMPNPDLKTALEALSLGKASWLTDLNYLLLKKMTPLDLLQALRRINTLLSIRLNIHETIPLPFRDFRIASGRSTFRVKDEFELDLSIANEDLTNQLFFIDFRFLFAPATSDLPASRLRDQIEFKVNGILEKNGLSGCFDFLHDLVLTHKISILRHQAYEMVRGHWADHLKVEPVHRSLVVQYWTQRSGGKNWIEIGIRKGKVKRSTTSSNRSAVPQIALRWFRAGKEVSDVPVNLGLGDVSLATILNQIIAMHTTFILKETTAKLRKGALYSRKVLKLKQSSSATSSREAVLFTQLTSRRAVKVVQEPVTGKFAVLPANHLNSRTEYELNGLVNPAGDASSRIANLRCVSAQEEFDIHARNSGWELVRSLRLDRETMERFFPAGTLRISFFRKRSWSSDWVLALTTSLAEDAVWIVQVIEGKIAAELTSIGLRTGPTVRVASKIRGTGIRALLVDPSCASLAHIERAAVGMISQYLNTRELTMNGIPHRLEPSGSAGPGLKSSTLHLYRPPPPSAAATVAPSQAAASLRNNIVSLNYHGVETSTSFGIHVAAARMKKAISDIKELTSNLSSTIAFHPQGGAFAFRLTTPVGTTTIPLLLHRITTIERLVQFLATIRRLKLPCNILSLTRLGFTYSSDPTLRAIVDFTPDHPMRISFDPLSPHLRIQDALTTILRSPEGGLSHVLAYLRITSSLLQQLSALEADHGSDADPIQILPRSAEWFEIRYHNPKDRVDIMLRTRQKKPYWLFRLLPTSKDEVRNSAVESGMQKLAESKGDGWEGVHTGVVASVRGVQTLLQKIDQIFQEARTSPQSTDPEATSDTAAKPNEESKQGAPNPRKRKADDVIELD